MDPLEDLREQWHTASEKDRPHDAVKVLVELERLEPHEPRWSQRLGEAYRRTGQGREAVDAFARAFLRYFERGFLPRAIAMAKLVKSLDAARGDLLESSLPKAASPPAPVAAEASPSAKASAAKPPSAKASPSPAAKTPAAKAFSAKASPSAAAKAPAATPAPSQPRRIVAEPLGAVAGPKPPRHAPDLPLPVEPLPFAAAKKDEPTAPVLPAKPVRPAPLARADDSRADEIRFADAPGSNMEFMLVEFMGGDSVAFAAASDEEADVPPTRPLGRELSKARDEPEYDAYATMATFRLFATLSRDALVALSNAAELVEFVPGAMIVVRDERAFALYAIVSGSARVTVPGSETEIRLKEGDVFGEASLLDEGQRQADVRAETPLMTLRVEKRALDEVTQEHPEVEDALFDLLARRLITNLMSTSPLFAAFEPTVRLELAQTFEVRRAPPGTVLAERGRRSDGLYVLLAGNVMAEAAGNAGMRIARGTAFGHASLLGAGTADVTIRAASEAVLLRMPAAGFTSLAAHYPPALAHLAETAHEPLPMSRREP